VIRNVSGRHACCVNETLVKCLHHLAAVFGNKLKLDAIATSSTPVDVWYDTADQTIHAGFVTPLNAMFARAVAFCLFQPNRRPNLLNLGLDLLCHGF
jgi:hypothetical protein